MSELAKNAIMDSFVQLISQRPLTKITVKDLTDHCGITRRTFYYHFQDIYDLIEQLFTRETERVVVECSRTVKPDNWEEAFIVAAKFVIENKTAVYHIYYSVRREELERYLKRISNEVIWQFINRIGRDIEANETDKKLISMFYCNAMCGMIQDWIENGMKATPDILIRRIGTLLTGNIERSLYKSAEESAKGRYLDSHENVYETEYRDNVNLLGQHMLGQKELLQTTFFEDEQPKDVD